MVSKISLVLLLGLSVQLASASRVLTFSGPGCSGVFLNEFEITPQNTWLNLCGAFVRSLVIPANTSVAFYEQCRDQSNIHDVDPQFKQIIKTDQFGDCVTFFAEPGEDINTVSISAQIISGVSDVCHEYASHVDEFCAESCKKECRDAIRSADDLSPICEGTQVSTVALQSNVQRSGRHGGRRHHRDESSSSHSHSDSEHSDRHFNENESEQNGQQKGGLRQKKVGFLRTHSKMIKDHRRFGLKHNNNYNAPRQQQEGQSNELQTTDYNNFVKEYHRSCKKEDRHKHMTFGCSFVFLLLVSLVLCCCCRRCYRKRCNKKCNAVQVPQMPQEMESPQRVFVATIVPASMVAVSENVQPVTVGSRVLPIQNKQIEADHALALELSTRS